MGTWHMEVHDSKMPSVPDHNGAEQTTATALRQADDLLSALGADAGWHQRGRDHQRAVGPVPV